MLRADLRADWRLYRRETGARAAIAEQLATSKLGMGKIMTKARGRG